MRFQGFPPARRIRERRDFLRIYAAGDKQHSRHFILFALFLRGEAQRVGLAVSRKVGKAVARNRVKRLLREYFRTRSYCMAGGQLVVVAKPGVCELHLKDVVAELDPLLERLSHKPYPASEPLLTD